MEPAVFCCFRAVSTIHLYPPFLPHIERLAKGRVTICASYCGLPSRSYWTWTQDHSLGSHMCKWWCWWGVAICLSATHHVHNCSFVLYCVVIAKWWDARLLTICFVRWSRQRLPAAQQLCSEKSSQLQSNMCMHLWHFVRFCDSFYCMFLSFFKSMCLMLGHVRGAKSAWCLVFSMVSKFS